MFSFRRDLYVYIFVFSFFYDSFYPPPILFVDLLREYQHYCHFVDHLAVLALIL